MHVCYVLLMLRPDGLLLLRMSPHALRAHCI